MLCLLCNAVAVVHLVSTLRKQVDQVNVYYGNAPEEYPPAAFAYVVEAAYGDTNCGDDKHGYH